MSDLSSNGAILIPGGGVRDGGLLPSWVRRRMDRAVELYKGEFVIPLSAGTTHRPPPLDQNGFPIFEAVAGAKYLVEAGIPAGRILIESRSLDTIGNAFFSRVVHVEPRGLRRLLVITSDFHLARTRAVFEWVYGLQPAPIPWKLNFEGVHDPEMDPKIERERRAKEREGLAALAQLTPRFSSLDDFHKWLFTEHAAYSALAPQSSSRIPAGGLLDSY
jgi:hypothetical protein